MYSILINIFCIIVNIIFLLKCELQLLGIPTIREGKNCKVGFGFYSCEVYIPSGIKGIEDEKDIFININLLSLLISIIVVYIIIRVIIKMIEIKKIISE